MNIREIESLWAKVLECIESHLVSGTNLPNDFEKKSQTIFFHDEMPGDGDVTGAETHIISSVNAVSQ